MSKNRRNLTPRHKDDVVRRHLKDDLKKRMSDEIAAMTKIKVKLEGDGETASLRRIFSGPDASREPERELPSANFRERVTRMFRRCMAREPNDDELKIMTEPFERTRNEGSNEASSWTLLANVLLNLDETITKE